MYGEFKPVHIITDLAQKILRIEMSLDVLPDTVNSSTIEITENESKRIVNIDPVVKGRFIDVCFKEWPAPNTEYYLKIQKGILSVFNDELPASLHRRIFFESMVTSSVNIVKPFDYEEITSLYIKWEEVPEQELAASYYIEIAKDPAFYNIACNTLIHGSQEAHIADIDDGQYYIRIRCQVDKSYGPWSNVITFVLKKDEEAPDDKDDEPFLEEDIIFVELPEDGITPESFLIKLDCEIDDRYGEITITKRKL